MIEEQITEGNKLIAEYMGYSNVRIDSDGVNCLVESPNAWKDEFPKGVIKFFEYHKDWNSLMSVVDKIESGGQILLFDELGKDRRRVVKFHSRPYYGFGDEKFTDTKIQAVFQAVVEVIERINENKLEEKNGIDKV